jgi:drug/metabolite transporter (DMT)-like permease
MGSYLYIAGTILFTVYGQIILKWRIAGLGFKLPDDSTIWEKLWMLTKLVVDPFMFSGFIAAFIASLFWMGAMSKFDITYAYPFMSLSPALVFLIGVGVLGEPFTIGKVLGLVLIAAGIFVTVKF